MQKAHWGSAQIANFGRLICIAALLCAASIFSGCANGFKEHKVDAALVSRHNGVAFIRYADPTSRKVRLGFIWMNTYTSGSLSASSLGLNAETADVYINDCYLAQWLPRDMLGPSCYTYRQPPLQPTDDALLTPLAAIRVRNDRITGMLSVKRYNFNSDYYLNITDAGQIQFAADQQPELTACKVKVLDSPASSPFNLIMELEQPLDVGRYAYLLLSCKRPGILLDLASESTVEEINKNYGYWYCVPLNIIADTKRLDTASKMDCWN